MKYIVGAYATAPSLAIDDETLELEFYHRLVQAIPDIRGLEIPFWGQEIHKFGSEFLFDIIHPGWENVLSCIPGTMTSLANNPRHGLASDDEDGRADAVSMHKRANTLFHRLRDRYGDQSVIAVQITTAPSTPVESVSSSAESLARSLEELCEWDWCRAKLIIEHCDASIEGQSFAKGFLSLEEELNVIQDLSEDYDIGMTINWARSAIEGRSTETPKDHLRSVSADGFLSGLIFSGVSAGDEQYGCWKDTHMPFAKTEDADYYEPNSLLTRDAVISCLSVLDLKQLDYLGIKLLSMPVDSATIDRRVGINRDAITTLNNIVKELVDD